MQLTYNEQVVDAGVVDGRNLSFSGTLKNTFTIANGTIDAGVDFFREEANNLDDTTGAVTATEKLSSIGVFAQVRQDVGQRVSLSYGARFDLQEFTGVTGQTFSEGGTSVNGSVDVILTDALTLNAGLASTWGGYELGEAGVMSDTWTYAGLKPSRATSGRIGLRYEQGPWSASIAYFDTTIRDVASVLPARGSVDRAATSKITSKGVDLSAQYNWATGFVKANYTDADVREDGEQIGSAAFYKGRPVGRILALEAGWDVSPTWSLGGSAEFAFDNTDGPTTINGYQVANAYASFTPAQMENLTVRFDVRNIFDATYSRSSSDGVTSTRVVPLTEPGRTFQLTGTFRF